PGLDFSFRPFPRRRYQRTMEGPVATEATVSAKRMTILAGCLGASPSRGLPGSNDASYREVRGAGQRRRTEESSGTWRGAGPGNALVTAPPARLAMMVDESAEMLRRGVTP